MNQALGRASQMQHAAEKTPKITTRLSRLTSNIRGPSQEKRQLLMSTTISCLWENYERTH